MDIWTTDEEAAKLRERFAKVKNRKKFALDHGIPGGDTMIYQHLDARRPMSQEAAVAYARAFQCGLEEISPRIAQEIAFRATMIGNKSAIPAPPHRGISGPSGWDRLEDDERAAFQVLIDSVLAGLVALPGTRPRPRNLSEAPERSPADRISSEGSGQTIEELEAGGRPAKARRHRGPSAA